MRPSCVLVIDECQSQLMVRGPPFSSMSGLSSSTTNMVAKVFFRIAATFIAVALDAQCVRGVNRQENMNPSNETTPNPSSSAPRRKLRILGLHGYHGSADILRAQMSALVSGLDGGAEFFLIDAPSREGGHFGWPHAVPMEASP